MRYYNKLADGGWNYSFVDPEMDKQFLNAASSRQGRFDKSNAMLQEQLTKLGETETFNPDQLQGRVSQLQDKVNQSIQDRYQGDYGAGANEIIRQLSAERRDPFYGMNKEQVRQGRLYDQARLKDPQNFIGLNDPRSVDISQTGATMDQLRPDYTSRTNDPKYVKERFSAAGNAVVDRIKNNSALPGYFEQIQNKGLSALDQEDWDEILSDSAVDDYIRESSYMKDPNIAEEDKTQEGAKAHLKDVMTGVYASQQQSKFIGDKAYDARLKAGSKTTEPLRSPYNTNLLPGVQKSSIDTLNDNFEKFSKASSNIKTFNDANVDGALMDKIKVLQGTKDTPSAFKTVGQLSTINIGSIRGFMNSDFTSLDKDKGKLSLQQSILDLYNNVYPDNDALRTKKNDDGSESLYIKDAANAGLVAKRVNDLMSNNPEELAKKSYNNAISPYKDNKSFQFLQSLNDEDGNRTVSDIDAAKIITDEQREQYMTHSNGYAPTADVVIKKINRDFMTPSNKSGKVLVYDEDGVVNEADGNIQDILAAGTLKNAELNVMDGSFELSVVSGSGSKASINKYKIPVEQLGNTNTKNAIKRYRGFLDDFYGQNGNVVSDYELPSGKEAYRTKVTYNEATKKFDREVYYRYEDSYGRVHQRKSDISEFANRAVTGVFDDYGKEPNYKIRKR